MVLSLIGYICLILPPLVVSNLNLGIPACKGFLELNLEAYTPLETFVESNSKKLV